MAYNFHESTSADIEVNVYVNVTTAIPTSCVQSIVNENYMIVLYLVIGLLGFVSNVFVVVVFAVYKPMRKRLTNVFIANLSAIDATVSFFLFFTTIYQNDFEPLTVGNWRHEVLCRVWFSKMPLWGMLISSTYGILALTLERYLGIVHPFWHKAKFTRVKIAFLLVTTWIVGPAYNGAYQIPTSAITPECQYTCTIYTAWPSMVIQQFVGVLTVILEYVLPLIVLIYCYSRMTIALRSIDFSAASNNTSIDDLNSAPSSVVVCQQQARARARQNVVKTLTTVAASYFVCWTPNQISYFLFNLGVTTTDINGDFHSFTIILVFINSCVNPIIYCIRYEQFQKGVRSICRRIRGAWRSRKTIHSRPTITNSSDDVNISSSLTK